MRSATERRRKDRLRDAQRMVQASRDELTRLALQQAALRRVATLVARGASPAEVNSSVITEPSRCAGVGTVALFRCETDGATTLVAACDASGLTKEPVISLDGENLAEMVSRMGRVARMNHGDDPPGCAGANTHEVDSRSGAGAPIVVDSRLWGSVIVYAPQLEPLPRDTDRRLVTANRSLRVAGLCRNSGIGGISQWPD